jgi:hypothetical protein
MSLLSVLKTIGKDLGHVGQWIDDGLKVIEPIAVAADPALGPILTAIEGALDRIPAGTKIDANMVQKIITSAATMAALTHPWQYNSPCVFAPPFISGIFAGTATVPLLVGRDQPNEATLSTEANTKCA